MPWRRQASATSATTSPVPPFQGEEATEYSVVAVGHRQKPSWCLAVRMTYFAPMSRARRTHSSASRSLGAKTSGERGPSLHSLPAKVFTPKWKKTPNPSRCQASCSGVGARCAAAEVLIRPVNQTFGPALRPGGPRCRSRPVPWSVDRGPAGLGVDRDLLGVVAGADVELVLDHPFVVLELPAAHRPVELLDRDLAGLVVAHRVVEVDGLFLVIGPLLLVGDDLAGDGVDDDLVIGAVHQDLDVPLPGAGILVVVELDGVERALAGGLLRRGHRVLGAHRPGLAAQIDVGPVLGGVLRGIAPIARAAAVAAAAVTAAALTAAAVALLDRPCAAVVLTGVAAASGESGDEHRAGRHQRCRTS